MNKIFKPVIDLTGLVIALVFMGSMSSFSVTAQTNPVKVRYDVPRDPKLTGYANLLKSGHLLEDMAKQIDSQIKLPKTLTLVGRQCDQVNAFYQPSTQSIEVCYEYLRQFEALQIEDLKDENGKFDRNEVARAILSTIKFTLYHELGHAVVHLLNLPVTGKEEDSVDQLATVVLLNSGEDADLEAIFDSAYSKLLRASRNEANLAKLTETQRQFWENAGHADEHSLDEQRYFDITCMVYGSNPQTFAELVTEGALPQERAASCPGEWKRISSSWQRLLAPYIPGAATGAFIYPPAPALPAKRPPSKDSSAGQDGDNGPVEWVDDPRNNVVEGIGLGRIMNRDDNDGGLLPGGVKLVPCAKPLAVKWVWDGLKTKKGMFYGLYCPPANPQYQELHAEMLKEHVLENIAVELNSLLRIPKPIVLSYRECNQANAFYSPGSSSVVMCYELIDTFYETFEKAGLKDAELDQAVGNAVTFAFYHELGHALVDVLKLPITGREEDAVDQLATFITADGSDEEETTALDGATAFMLLAKNTQGQQTPFWDQHSLGEQRFYSILCSLYGDSPEKYAGIVTDGTLPKARAARCHWEWKRIESSWSRLLAPHIKQG